MVIDAFELELDGATLVGCEAGEGLAVVFLHAGVGDLRMWQHQIAAVAERGWHALAYDRRGFGDSEADDVAFSHTDDLEAVLEALDHHAAVLVGCSAGGELAIDFALRHPGRVLGLVLIGTSVAGAPWTATAEERAIEMAEEEAWEREDLDMINRVLAHQWLDGPRARNGRVGGAVRELFLDMNGKALDKPRLRHAEPAARAWQRMEEVSAPTLLIVGDQDFTALVERHDELSERMPNAFATVLEGCAHLPSIEQPELVSRLIGEFLDVLSGEPDGDEDQAVPQTVGDES